MTDTPKEPREAPEFRIIVTGKLDPVPGTFDDPQYVALAIQSMLMERFPSTYDIRVDLDGDKKLVLHRKIGDHEFDQEFKLRPRWVLIETQNRGLGRTVEYALGTFTHPHKAMDIFAGVEGVILEDT